MSTETIFTVTLNGQPTQVSRDQLWALMSTSGRVTEVTISVKETRWPVRSQGHDKFLSARRECGAAFDLADTIQDWNLRQAARQMAMQAVQKDIVETEEWLSQILGFFWMKDNQTPSWRHPENPAVKAGWDIQTFLRSGGLNVDQSRSGTA